MLKVSGEALQGSKGFGLDPSVVEAIALEIKAARQHGIQVAVVVGGGNYFRGASAWKGLERATADYVGMLATVMNALCLQVRLYWHSFVMLGCLACPMSTVLQTLRKLPRCQESCCILPATSPWQCSPACCCLLHAKSSPEACTVRPEAPGCWAHSCVLLLLSCAGCC
jgi:uridylate kinase